MAAPSNSQRKTSAAAFHPISLPARLTVPVLSRGFQPRPAGSILAIGDALTLDGHGFSPAAGKIIGPARAYLLNGQIIDAVEMETVAEKSESLAPDSTVHPPFRSTELGPWIDYLQRVGVNALRWGSPDLLEQLRIGQQQPLDSLICCLLDCDPNLPINSLAAYCFPHELAAGINLLSQLSGVKRTRLAVDPATSPRSLTTLDPLIRADGLRVAQLPADYPQADPTVLLYTLTKRRRQPDESPAQHGVLLLDAVAAIAVGYLALHGRPLPAIPLAVRDHLTGRSYFLAVVPGTHLAHICTFLGLPWQTPVFRVGDFLRDVVLPSTAVVGPGELTVHLSATDASINPDPCVRCGWCMDACPTRVQPARLLEAAQQNDLSLAKRFGLHACIECGICSYVCPSRLPLLKAIRKLKRGGSNPFSVLA